MDYYDNQDVLQSEAEILYRDSFKESMKEDMITDMARFIKILVNRVLDLEEQIKDLRGEIQGNDEEWK